MFDSKRKKIHCPSLLNQKAQYAFFFLGVMKETRSVEKLSCSTAMYNLRTVVTKHILFPLSKTPYDISTMTKHNAAAS